VAALDMGVCPAPSRGFFSAPAASSVATALSCPYLAWHRKATISWGGVLEYTVQREAAFIRKSADYLAARCTGVDCVSSLVFRSLPFASNNSITCIEP